MGLLPLMILTADLLPPHMGVGSGSGIPSSASTDLMRLTFFAAVTAAMSSALAELRAVINCALD